MKLTDKYTNIGEHSLPDNELYNYYQPIWDKIVFAPTPDFNLNNCSINNGIYSYNCTADENEFYNTKYIPLLDIIYKDHCKDLVLSGLTTIPNDLRNTLTNIEKYILNFIYDGGNRFIVTGKKGWGKSTLIRNMVCNIIPKLNLSGGNKYCTPVYISFNTHINDFNKAKNSAEIENIFYKVLSNRMAKFCESFLYENLTGEFFSWLLKQEEYAIDRINLNNIEKDAEEGLLSSIERDKKLSDLRTSILNDNNARTLLYAFSFLSQSTQNPSIPVVFLDDLDPLNFKVQRYIFEEIYTLAHHYNIKVVATMRPYSLDRVNRESIMALPLRNYALEMPNLETYLSHKTQLMSVQINSLLNKAVQLNDKTIQFQDAPKYLDFCIKTLLNRDSLFFLKSIADGDIRIFNELIHVYFSSGYISSVELISKMLQKNVGMFDALANERQNQVPMWIVFSSIITNNHKTVFGRKNNQPSKYVMNILCNGHQSVNSLLIRLHLLAFFIRQNSNQHGLESIYSKYSSMVASTCVNEYDLRLSLTRAIKRFANARLIGNNNRLRLPDAFLAAIENEDEFYIENLGNYYYNHFLSMFEYIMFMKDDMDLGDNPYGIRDCIEVTRPIDRFIEVVKYLKHLYKVEVDFIKNLTASEFAIYKTDFSPIEKNKTMFVQVLIDRMYMYAQTRKSIFSSKENNENIESVELDSINSIIRDLDELNNNASKYIESIQDKLGVKNDE